MTTIMKRRSCKFLQAAARFLVSQACRLLRAAGVRPNAEAVVRIIESIPRDTREADDGSCPCRSLYAFCMAVAEAAPMRAEQFNEFRRVASFFLDRLPAIPFRRRQVLEAAALAIVREQVTP